MTSPQHLHAHANLWSLTTIWPHLAQAAQNAQNAEGVDRGTVQAWRPGSGVHSGPNGDLILDAILRNDGPDANPYADRLQHATKTILWLASCVLPPDVPNTTEALRELLAGLDDLRPATALNIALWTGAEDRNIRKLLREPTDHQAIDGLLCPYCDTAALAIRSSAPPLQRPTICTAGCTCDGPSCPCGMDHPTEGIPHIWTHDQLAAALDTKDAAA